MTLRTFIPLATVSLLLFGCQGAESGDDATAMSLPETIGDWALQPDPVTYDRETIFDYINGAGEVYRAYAFSHVDVERYERGGGDGVTVEVFDMGNPHDAFGVFSYARESEEEGIGAGFERKGSVLCFWQDRFYVCVAAEQRYDDPGPVLEEVARGISASLPPGGTRPALVDALPAEGLIPASDRFFHLHQVLNYNYYLVRENVLNLSPDTDAVLARYAPGSTYLVLIEYPGEGEAAQALGSLRQALVPEAGDMAVVEREAGKYLAAGQAGSYLAVVLDAPASSDAEALLGAALERLAQLTP